MQISSSFFFNIYSSSSNQCMWAGRIEFNLWSGSTDINFVQRYRWRGKGIQRSESARLINMRQPSLQPRQNSHPNLVHQTSYSSSSSSLADRSSLESHSFQQYKVGTSQNDRVMRKCWWNIFFVPPSCDVQTSCQLFELEALQTSHSSEPSSFSDLATGQDLGMHSYLKIVSSQSSEKMRPVFLWRDDNLADNIFWWFH